METQDGKKEDTEDRIATNEYAGAPTTNPIRTLFSSLNSLRRLTVVWSFSLHFTVDGKRNRVAV